MRTTNKAIDTRIFKMKSQGNSHAKIAKTLNSEGVKTCLGNSWTASNISNRFYLKTATKKTRPTGSLTLTLNDIATLNVNRKVKLALIGKMI